MKDAGHNDVDLIDRKTFFSNLIQFIKNIKEVNNAMNLDDILKKNRASIWINEYNHKYKKLINKFDNSSKNSNCDSLKETEKTEKSDLN